MRNVMVTTMDEDYVLVAQAKGLGKRRVVWYAARNAILPSVSGFSLAIGFVVSGALLTEIVFSYPGLGWILLQAVNNRDYPLLQGIFLSSRSPSWPRTWPRTSCTCSLTPAPGRRHEYMSAGTDLGTGTAGGAPGSTRHAGGPPAARHRSRPGSQHPAAQVTEDHHRPGHARLLPDPGRHRPVARPVQPERQRCPPPTASPSRPRPRTGSAPPSSSRTCSPSCWPGGGARSWSRSSPEPWPRCCPW